MAQGGRSVAFDQRSIVLDDALQRLPAQIETVECRIPMFENGDDTQRLTVVIETTIGAKTRIEGPFAGVTEWRMAEIVGERQRFG